MLFGGEQVNHAIVGKMENVTKESIKTALKSKVRKLYFIKNDLE